MRGFGNTIIEINCEKCGYLIDVTLMDVKVEKFVICHNCKTSIQLIDGDASAHTTIASSYKLINDIETLFKKFN